MRWTKEDEALSVQRANRSPTWWNTAGVSFTGIARSARKKFLMDGQINQFIHSRSATSAAARLLMTTGVL